MRTVDPRAAAVSSALRALGLSALPDRNGRAVIDVYAAWADLAEPTPYAMVAYFDLEPLEALDDRGIAQEVLRQLGEHYLKL